MSWPTGKLFGLLLAAFVAAGLSMSAVQASDIAINMGMSSGMDMSGGGCGACPDKAPDKSVWPLCPSACVLPVMGLVSSDKHSDRRGFPCAGAASAISTPPWIGVFPPDPYPPESTPPRLTRSPSAARMRAECCVPAPSHDRVVRDAHMAIAGASVIVAVEAVHNGVDLDYAFQSFDVPQKL